MSLFKILVRFLRSRTQTHNTFVLLAVKSNNPLTHRISLHTRKKQKNRYMYYWKWMMMFFFLFRSVLRIAASS